VVQNRDRAEKILNSLIERTLKAAFQVLDFFLKPSGPFYIVLTNKYHKQGNWFWVFLKIFKIGQFLHLLLSSFLFRASIARRK